MQKTITILNAPQNLYFSFTILLLLWFSFDSYSQCSVVGEKVPCVGDTFTYVHTYPLTGSETVVWSISGADIISQTSDSVVLAWHTAGHSEVSLSIYSTGTLIDLCRLSVQVFSADFSLTGLPDIVCVNVPVEVELQSITNNTYVWDFGGFAVDTVSNGDKMTITFLDTGQVTITITGSITEGCSVTKTFYTTVTELADPEISIVGGSENGDTTEVCVGEDILLMDTIGIINTYYTIVWEIAGNGSVWNFYNETFVLFNFPEAGTYRATLHYQNNSFQECMSTIDTVWIKVLGTEAIEIICPSVVCESDTILYQAIGDCAEFEWTVSAEGTIITDLGDSILVAWNVSQGAGLGYVMVEGMSCSSNVCTAPAIQVVPIFPTEISIVGDTVLCDASAATYTLPNLAGAQYTWTTEIIDSVSGSIAQGNSIFPYQYILSVDDFVGTIRIIGRAEHSIAGCLAEDTITVHLLNNSLAGPDQLCPNTSADLFVLPAFGGSVDWQVILSGNVIYTQNNHGDSITLPASVFSAPGVYTVEATITQSSDICILHKVIEVVEIQPIENINGPTEVCLDTVYTYKTAFGGIVHWIIEQGDSTQLLTGSCAEVIWTSSTGPYVIKAVRENVFDFGSCFSDTFGIEIEVLNTSTITISGNTTPCPDSEESYQAMPDGGAFYVWSLSAPFGSIIDGQGTPNVTILWHYQDTFVTLSVDAILCGDTIHGDTLITITPFRPAVIGDTLACANTNVQFTTNATTASAYRWQVNGVVEGNSATFNHTFEEPGQYLIQLNVRDPNGCPGHFSVLHMIEILYNPKPEIANIATLPCPAGTPFTRTLEALHHGPYTYTWYLNGQVVDSGPSLTIDTTGFYILEVDYGGCINTDGIDVDYDCGSGSGNAYECMLYCTDTGEGTGPQFCQFDVRRYLPFY